MLTFLDLVGVFVFALSGAIGGRLKQFDLFGMFMLALVTATGGGTLRSILIGDLPPVTLRDISYILVPAAATVTAFFAQPLWERFSRAVSFFDALGLGLFSCLGVQVSLKAGLSPWAAIGLGMVTATFGGVLRDLLRGEIPLVFRKEVYATAALIGGGLYYGSLSLGLSQTFSLTLGVLLTATVRLLAIRYKVNLPGSSV